MGTIFGLIESRPRFKLIRVSDLTMKEIYLDNDHLVDYRAQERTTGKFQSGLSLTASLSLNPTGSAVVSQVLSGPVVTYAETSSFALTQTFSSSFSASVTSSFTASVYEIASASFTASVSQSNDANVTLAVNLIENPPRSGEYVGIIPGADITSALSGSFTQSFSSSFSTSSNSVTTQSFIPGTNSSESIIFNTTSSFVESFTQSIEEPLVETSPRSWAIYEIVQSSDASVKISTPMNLRSVRFAS
jgi:hypothetical protein